MSGLLSTLLVVAIRGYQLAVSPWLGPCCRFHPSCSAYAIEAIQLHGPARGLWLGIRRIGRCHPFHPGGIDPVPAAPAGAPRIDGKGPHGS